MSFLEELKNEDNFKSQLGSICTVCRLLAGLAPDEAKLLAARIAYPEVPKAAIARVLNKNGFKIAPNTITRHARKECLGA
jgi:hypothetical protein